MGRGENPWELLRDKPEVRLVWSELPEGVDGLWRGDEIHLDYRLTRTERRCALMHELVHYERQVGWPAATLATMQSEERMVRAEVARRMVPLDVLADWVARRCEVEPVTPALVADEWDVTPDVALLALSLLSLSP